MTKLIVCVCAMVLLLFQSESHGLSCYSDLVKNKDRGNKENCTQTQKYCASLLKSDAVQRECGDTDDCKQLLRWSGGKLCVSCGGLTYCCCKREDLCNERLYGKVDAYICTNTDGEKIYKWLSEKDENRHTNKNNETKITNHIIECYYSDPVHYWDTVLCLNYCGKTNQPSSTDRYCTSDCDQIGNRCAPGITYPEWTQCCCNNKALCNAAGKFEAVLGLVTLSMAAGLTLIEANR